MTNLHNAVKTFFEMYHLLKRLRDLADLPEDTLFLCDDPEIMSKCGFREPFQCGAVSWRGAGLVSINFYTHVGELYPESAYTFLKHLKPLPGEKWHDNRPSWQ